MKQDVVIIGAGLAGLCCARELVQNGLGFVLLESSDGVGGRMRTDVVNGFRLDRGFQVFLTSYPEAKRILDFKKLQLYPFLPGALVRYDGRFHELTDPWRRPFAAMRSVWSPVGSLADKLRIASLRRQSLRAEVLAQLGEWFGDTVQDWNHLKTFMIAYALPSQLPPALHIPQRPVRWQPGIYVCGDHRDNASIQGAMVSGRRAAEAVMQDLSSNV